MTTPPPAVHPTLNLAPLADQVQTYLHAFLQEQAISPQFHQALQYALLAPGKRLRPALTLLTAQAITTQNTQAIIPAAAIEMIHCFSLIHDDLPAMDDDDLRRGRPTLHKKYDQATAILAGDILQSLAFQLINTQLPQALALPISNILATATSDMILGQVYDTLHDFPQDLTDIQKLELIHHNKTGALIIAACQMGAVTAHATPQQFNAITNYAQAIGLMFQIVDDILDITQSTQQLGKTAGKDIQQNKLTYPALIGLAASKHKISQLQDDAHQALSIFPKPPQTLSQLIDALATRQK